MQRITAITDLTGFEAAALQQSLKPLLQAHAPFEPRRLALRLLAQFHAQADARLLGKCQQRALERACGNIKGMQRLLPA